MVYRRLPDHTRRGLATETVVLGRMGACVYSIDISPLSLEFSLHFHMNPVEGFESKPMMTNGRLISNDNEKESSL
jgi:hypothetical protein